jgi:hypothetical protein
MSFLFDVRPDPVQVTGVGGLILLAVVVLTITAALIVGLVFLLKALKRGSSSGLGSKLRRLRFTRLILGDVCFSFDGISPQSNAVSHNSPSREKRER